MRETQSVRCAGVPVADPSDAFAFERWDVYRVAREFQTVVPLLVPRRGNASLRDQLDRASASVLLNIAEGAGRSARAEKAQFYSIARGSVQECVAAIDIAIARGLIGEADHRHARGLLVRVSQMLTKLILRMR